MAKGGVNKVILLGNLGKAFESKTLNGGKVVGTGSLAVSDSKGETTWFRLVAWDKTAELLAQFGEKGKQLYVEGRLQVRQFTDKSGNEKEVTEVVVSDFKLLGPVSAPSAPVAQSASDDDYDDNGGLPF